MVHQFMTTNAARPESAIVRPPAMATTRQK
jgi:hypothetical protein